MLDQSEEQLEDSAEESSMQDSEDASASSDLKLPSRGYVILGVADTNLLFPLEYSDSELAITKLQLSPLSDDPMDIDFWVKCFEESLSINGFDIQFDHFDVEMLQLHLAMDVPSLERERDNLLSCVESANRVYDETKTSEEEAARVRREAISSYRARASSLKF